MSSPLLLTALKVLVLAGGASPEENHHSHKVHVDALVSLLAERGVPGDDVVVFWADGAAPEADRSVVAEGPIDGAWLIEGTRLDTELAVEPAQVDTQFVPPARPATEAALTGWLAEVGPTLGAGDTLLIAVTDHGVPDPSGGAEVAISLWGEKWTTSELEAALSPVPRATRVVLWMSQCFSGGFADLHRRRENLCGVFAAHPDRPAYGCHPRLAGRDDVGHFLRMVEALARHGTLAAAHEEVLLTDDTPDTPHLTSDVMLFEAVDARAGEGTTAQRLIDARVPAEVDDPTWKTLAALSARYGLGAVTRYGEALDLIEGLDRARYALSVWGERWYEADLHARGLVAEPLVRVARPARDRSERWAQRKRAVTAMQGLLATDPPLRARVTRLRAKVEAARALEAQIELQEAAAIRAAYLVSRMAGPRVVDARAKARYAALRACEQAPLIPAGPVAIESPVAPTPLPPASRVAGQVEALRPGWLGVGYRDAPRHAGAVVDRLLPGSPALGGPALGGPALGGALAVGDRVVAVDGWTLRRRGGFREAALLADPGGLSTLTVKRRRGTEDIALRAAPMPLPPRPPLIGQPLPPLGVEALDARNAPPRVGEGQAVLLFYWETTCEPCRAAIPVLSAWADRHDVAVMAISGEPKRTVAQAVKRLKMPFAVALDPSGEAARLLAVEARPVFALVDAGGVLVDVGDGFDGVLPLGDPPPLPAPPGY